MTMKTSQGRRRSRRRARDENPNEERSTPCTVSHARLLDLQGRNDAVVSARRGNLLSARQRSVTQKEFRMAENRGRRAEELLGRVGSRRAREDPVPEVVDAGGDVSKRRRVGDDPPRDFEHAFELEKEEHMIMEVDAVNSIHIMGTVHTMDRIEGGEQVPFSPPACSPSRRPWQLRPTPETIPDDHGRLTREWLPPVSPYGLIEEDQMVFRDPFKLLVVCQLLNKTGATMVRQIPFAEVPHGRRYGCAGGAATSTWTVEEAGGGAETVCKRVSRAFLGRIHGLVQGECLYAGWRLVWVWGVRSGCCTLLRSDCDDLPPASCLTFVSCLALACPAV